LAAACPAAGRLRRYTIGHEIGHWEFHAEDVRAGMLSLLDGDRIWCRTGSPDPAERQAEIFSAFRKACDTKPTFTDRMP
jgi:hypothetical protein